MCASCRLLNATVRNTITLAAAANEGAIVLVDKTADWTSHDVVARTRRVMGTRKVGHAGTLDPMATGLLTLGVGNATRLLTHFVGLDKVYKATIRLGQQTLTDDATSPATASADPARIAEVIRGGFALLNSVAADFCGEILQVPSTVSAIRKDGKRAYELVREGTTPELTARQVTVHKIELAEPELVVTGDGGVVIDVRCLVHVSSGTYVRALARDIGAKLGVYGHLIALRRVRVGPFKVADAVPLQTLDEQARRVSEGLGVSARVIPVLSAAQAAQKLFPVIVVTADEAIAIGHGKRPSLSRASAYMGAAASAAPSPTPHTHHTPLAAAVSESGSLLALVEIKNGIARVVTGFPQSKREAL
ncbi:tRNA pseudouridine(55) synthase TruB [Canibacter zhuwentaonis]|uniref:tRNA pseudouridine(55) synthase TruB n=1 Tax=Canibacter zhuwentaonis TaxID=2837491 RepID=UPI0020290E51|nr:tRNA pseudouridine(55) synthase TruB [Canibacter zhuwentaonis]